VQVQHRQHIGHLRVLRAHGGKIAELNRIRSPVSGSARLSFTRGAETSTAPAPVSTVRGSAVPLRTTIRRPFSSRTSANWPQRLGQHLPSALAHDLIDQRRLPSRQRGRHVRDYCEHRCAFPASVAAPAIA
jgi:hypothetical protein